ncbi:hypothetical protein BRDID11004_60420 [Bradyrhizobium diazoefficiens]|uniref:Uncharacterized protein n=1 Tax=Bradyrhizobium diazoefficiens TaxID=1355477 RepID=A0A810AHG8_9BRAD|nr:hypothetical protein F07S3_28930 [Bradyrhizobium diazoefficiens]BCA10810.1 hypothetical protein BDHF08_26570 [Bradyrhizobium diazoefficiens]BCE55146.1 hypothetical protein XF5B_26580 [Bradyrhizobium diazoefficiens]BCE63879.1 hypothetical protein XF6B_26780 [Bradyrhizobium diazoefficiens]
MTDPENMRGRTIRWRKPCANRWKDPLTKWRRKADEQEERFSASALTIPNLARRSARTCC